MINLQKKILELIESDSDFSTMNNNAIIKIYKDSSSDMRIVIDSIFIHLTGYSLANIIKEKE